MQKDISASHPKEAMQRGVAISALVTLVVHLLLLLLLLFHLLLPFKVSIALLGKLLHCCFGNCSIRDLHKLQQQQRQQLKMQKRVHWINCFGDHVDDARKPMQYEHNVWPCVA